MNKKIIFERESDNFTDILTDIALKKYLKFKIRFKKVLIIELPEKSEVLSYVELKYGEDIKNNLVRDYSPIINVDYLPKRNN